MNTYIFIGGAAVIGALAGFAAGWFISKRHYQTTIDRKADEEIQRMKEYYEEKYSEDEYRAHNKKRVDAFTNIVEATKKATKAMNDICEDQGYSEKKEKPSKISSFRDDSLLDLFPNTSEEYRRIPPYIIDYESFNSEKTNYDKITLEYFTEDGIVVENDEPLIDLTNTIGNTLDYFDRNELTSMYVRNDNFAIDYEIVKVEGRWSDDNE